MSASRRNARICQERFINGAAAILADLTKRSRGALDVISKPLSEAPIRSPPQTVCVIAKRKAPLAREAFPFRLRQLDPLGIKCS